MVASKTKKITLITKNDIKDALSTFDDESIKELRDSIKSKFPEKKKKASTAKPTEAKPKTSKKTSKPTEAKPKTSKMTSKPKTSKKTATQVAQTPEVEELEHKYKVGDKVFVYFGKDQLQAKVKELLPNRCYCIEWLNFKENYNHPFFIKCPVKYVHENLCHDLMESEVIDNTEK